MIETIGAKSSELLDGGAQVEFIDVDAPDQNQDRIGESFEEVFEREQHNMVRLAYLLLNSQAQAEEVAQDAFARLLDRFDKIQNPGGFVRTATINRCRDLLRRRQRERRIFSRFKGQPIESVSVLAADRSSVELGPGVEISDVLARLTPRAREIVVLRFYLGQTHGEIANQLDMNEKTVRTALHRALTVLRKELS